MSEPEIEWSPSALKDVRKLPLQDRRRIGAALHRLVIEPHLSDCKKLEGDPPRWRLRVGDWRVVFVRRDRLIRITAVFHRQAGY